MMKLFSNNETSTESDFKIRFIADQIGTSENEFMAELIRIFETQEILLRAYLSQVEYRNSKKNHVALCIHSSFGEDKELLDKAASLFRRMFGSHEHLDIIFITDEQEIRIRKVCCPFYTSQQYQYREPDFYLTSSEGYDLEMIRKCYKAKRLQSKHSDGYMLCNIDPPIMGQPFGMGNEDIESVILASRHDGYSLFSISEWPAYVHVARILIGDLENKYWVDESEIKSIGWAELYETYDSAMETIRKH